MVPPRSDTTAFGHPSLRGMFLAGIRDYLAPGTERGSDASKLLPPRILTFTKPLLPKSAEDCLRGGHLRRARPEHRSRIVCPQRIVGLRHLHRAEPHLGRWEGIWAHTELARSARGPGKGDGAIPASREGPAYGLDPGMSVNQGTRARAVFASACISAELGAAWPRTTSWKARNVMPLRR
jgi:hypothetical protein